MQTTRNILIAVIVALVVIGAFAAAFSFFKARGGVSLIPSGTSKDETSSANDADADVFVSKDGGATWQGVAGTDGISPAVFRLSRTGDAIYIGTRAKGIWKGDKDGARFSRVGDKDMGVEDLTIPKRTGVDAYIAATYDNKGRILELSESTFRERYFTPVPRVAVTGIVTDARDDKRLYATTGDGGFLVSEDGGVSWKLVYSFKGGVSHIVANPNSPGVFWVSLERGGVLLTTNGGTTWESLDAGLRSFSGARVVSAMVFDIRTGSLYLTSTFGIVRSHDGGRSWKQVKLPTATPKLEVSAFAVDPIDSNVLFASLGSQLYTSTDGGNSWAGQDLGGKRSITAIFPDPAHAKRIFIGFDK